MDRCKCGSFAINEHAHGRIKGKHSDLCDVCYWREEAKQARQAAAREILEWAAGPESYDEWVVMVRERFGLEGVRDGSA